MKILLHLLVLAFLAAVAPIPCLALMELADVSKEEAKKLGIEIRSHAAGPDAAWIEMEFETKNGLKNFSRVELDFREGGKSLMSSSLKEDRSRPGRILVSFTADRAKLANI